VHAAQDAIAAAAGSAPLFFRAPFGMRSPLLDPVLARAGLRYVSWTRRAFDTRIDDPQRVADRLARGLAAGDILLLHDAMATGVKPRTGLPAARALPLLAARVRDAGLRAVTLRSACGDALGR
jgi:peptidoglycan/xylan/chitin deacetylase (PgdA/CDA1 family)